MGDLVRQTIAAGGRMEVGRGRFFRLVKCTDPVDVEIIFPTERKRVTQIEAGYAFGPLHGREYRGVAVLSATAQSVEVFNGEDAESYDRTVMITQAAPAAGWYSSAVGYAAGLDALLLTAYERRRRTVVQLDPAAPGGSSITVKSGTGGVTDGIHLAPGQMLELFHNRDIYVKNNSAGLVNVFYLTEVNS